MSTNEQVLNTANQAITNYDTSKLLLWNNRFRNASYINSTYDDITLAQGTLMGIIGSTGEAVPCESDASDGSQYPVGVLAYEYVVEGGDEVSLTICIGGDIAEEKVVFAKVGDDFDTTVSDRTFRDRIAGDTLGIKLVSGTEMTAEDNQ